MDHAIGCFAGAGSPLCKIYFHTVVQVHVMPYANKLCVEKEENLPVFDTVFAFLDLPILLYAVKELCVSQSV